MALQFAGTVLSLHVDDLGYSTYVTGFGMVASFAMFAIVSPFVYILTDRTSKRSVIVFGEVLVGIGMFCLGIVTDRDYILASMGLVGGGFPLILVPALPEMMEAVKLFSTKKYITATETVCSQ